MRRVACEDTNSKLVEVVTDVDDERRFDNSFMQIWKLKFGQKIKFLYRLWEQGVVKILMLKLKKDFEAEV